MSNVYKDSSQIMVHVYRSGLTPKPGPGGGSVNEVKPPAGSQEKRPFLMKARIFKSIKTSHNVPV